ncbi:MAG: PIN domain-containing protein [Anaerolineae bacterium]|nr:PIN domain-containing protein [Anaerolineae bacterium]
MDWLEPLRGDVVGLDTSVFIYFIQRHPDYMGVVRPFFAALDRHELDAVTSVVSLIEVLVQPLRHGDQRLASEYRDILLHADGLTTLPVTSSTAEMAARLRAEWGIRTPDAIQMATALQGGATHFLTNDHRLPRTTGLSLLILDELRPVQ